MTAGEYNTHPVENWRRENGEAPDPEATIDSYKWLDEVGFLPSEQIRPMRAPDCLSGGFFCVRSEGLRTSNYHAEPLLGLFMAPPPFKEPSPSVCAFATLNSDRAKKKHLAES